MGITRLTFIVFCLPIILSFLPHSLEPATLNAQNVTESKIDTPITEDQPLFNRAPENKVENIQFSTSDTEKDEITGGINLFTGITSVKEENNVASESSQDSLVTTVQNYMVEIIHPRLSHNQDIVNHSSVNSDSNSNGSFQGNGWNEERPSVESDVIWRKYYTGK